LQAEQKQVMLENKKITIAIDGFSSCGKSTVAKQVAKALNYIYVDSGAMYRAVTLYTIEHNLWENDTLNEVNLQKAISSIDISFTYDEKNQQYLTWLNGKMVEKQIRSLEVSGKVSPVATLGFVREALVEMQQKMGTKGGIIMDGRDIGTVVFPQAELKVFMTASPDVRAQRRLDELKEKGEEASFEAVKQNIETRDHIDQNREISPLKKAEDALTLDNSNISREKQLEIILQWVKERIQ
jgi:cytidylate kinase